MEPCLRLDPDFGKVLEGGKHYITEKYSNFYMYSCFHLPN